MKNEKPKILIIYGYHPKEAFAIKVGQCLRKNYSNPNVRIERYKGKSDSKRSTYHLRRFIGRFDPVISAIVLHDDHDTLGADKTIVGAFIYCAKSRDDRNKAIKPLLDFVKKYADLPVTYGRFLARNPTYSWIDSELNPNVNLAKAAHLVISFAEYLLNLYSNMGIKL